VSYLVVGSGSIGKRHHANLSALGKDVRLIGWRGLDLTSLDLSDATGLIVATATQVRADLIARAAEAGVPVYVEKPLAYRTADLEHMLRLASPIAARSVLGLMMRYHPTIRWLVEGRPEAFGFNLEIGHDVRQWRPNWCFADSYAALPEGGGVLLDLCHEIDMAACLFPGLSVVSVDCIGHEDFPGVDFATRITLAGNGITGTVAMDYLSPESIRKMAIRGRDEVLDLDLLGPTARRWRAGVPEPRDWKFERNDMFLALMSDFTALAEGRPPSDNPLLPRLDRIAESARLTAEAWEKRRFHGTLTGGFE
jgi:predicted dehydrogenase